MIGFTERGDAGIDLTWVNKVDTVDGLVLITKNITDTFITKVLEVIRRKPVILHCTCTGYGGTAIEPNVPKYTHQLNQLKKLIDAGFPKENVVIRIDPIIPLVNGFKNVETVMTYAHQIGVLTDRIRISLLDMYPHTRARLQEAGFTDFYNGSFYPNVEMTTNAAKVLNALAKAFNVTVETCAEDSLVQIASQNPNNRIRIAGCISLTDLQIMGLERLNTQHENAQNRNGCHCLAIKRELLECKTRCAHKCLYCFWRD